MANKTLYVQGGIVSVVEHRVEKVSRFWHHVGTVIIWALFIFTVALELLLGYMLYLDIYTKLTTIF